MEGGIDAWRKAGLEVARDRRQPLELMRQVQITVGVMILLGVVLSSLVDPLFMLLPAFAGVGLMVSGTTGWCGMARLLHRMPWNRPASA